MTALTVTSLAPFVPSGADYAGSRALFTALGFVEEWENNGLAGFRCGEGRFILQRFDDAAFAANLMIKLVVPDLDRWWAEVARRDLVATFPTLRFKPPAVFPWGRELTFIDLAGVCWHVAAS